MTRKMSLVIMAGTFCVAVSPVALSDWDDYWSEGGPLSRTPDVAAVSNAQYQEECGACHFAYPPGLLPARSWQKIMANLDDHFAENAELLPDTQAGLTDYLVANSADKSEFRRSKKIARSLKAGDAPLRITGIPYMRHEHDEIPQRLVKDNPKVMSFSNCTACHTRADKGSFSENEINISGFGPWDD